MQSRFRRILSAVRENCLVSYAKIVIVGGFRDIDLIVIRATAPNDLPLPEKYVQELLKIFAFSPPSFQAFSLSFSRRFGNTRCWRVGLKCLVLLHRLLHSVPENSAFRLELLRSRANGSMSLDHCHFRDEYLFASEDYASFIRSYAQLLDETLDCYSFYKRDAHDDSGDEEVIGTITSKMDEINRALEVLPQLQSLIDRVIACRPIGKAERSIAVWSVMKHIPRESFRCYRNLCPDIDLVQENLLQMPYRNSITAIAIYNKAAIQANELSELYDWCQLAGVCRQNEYPAVHHIQETGIRTLESFIGRMWQLTESSSSSTAATSISSPPESPPSADDRSENEVVAAARDVVVSNQWEIFEDSDFPAKNGENEKAMIELQLSEDSSWEDLLEASAILPWNPMNSDSYDWGKSVDGSDAWKM